VKDCTVAVLIFTPLSSSFLAPKTARQSPQSIQVSPKLSHSETFELPRTWARQSSSFHLNGHFFFSRCETCLFPQPPLLSRVCKQICWPLSILCVLEQAPLTRLSLSFSPLLPDMPCLTQVNSSLPICARRLGGTTHLGRTYVRNSRDNFSFVVGFSLLPLPRRIHFTVFSFSSVDHVSSPLLFCRPPGRLGTPNNRCATSAPLRLFFLFWFI